MTGALNLTFAFESNNTVFFIVREISIWALTVSQANKTEMWNKLIYQDYRCAVVRFPWPNSFNFRLVLNTAGLNAASLT